jgi:hypothetical protein
MGDNPLGLELTEAAAGGSRCLIAEVDTRVGGSEKSAASWLELTEAAVRRDNRAWPCRLAV